MNIDNGNSEHPEVLEFMRTRRSVPAKTMTGPGPDDGQLRLILEIATRVPDHGKLAPWRLIRYGAKKRTALGEKLLVRAKELADEQGRTISEAEEQIELNRFLHTPVVICITSDARPHPKIPEWEQVLSSGAVAMNMLIAANASGFDAQWLTEWYAFDDTLKSEFGLKDGEKIAGFIHIGSRQNPKTERDRPDIDNVYIVLDN